MTDSELIAHKKALVKKWNRKTYIKRKCNNRIFEIEDLIAETHTTLEREVLEVLFEELDTLLEQRDDIIKSR